MPKLNKHYAQRVVPAADKISQNQFRYFFDKSYDLGEGPDWFLNPVTGKRAKSGLHWCDINLFDPAVGDIKFIWEPSRFAWVYTLVRAYAATGEDKYVEKFWALFESWLEANQPNVGPNYACGQECAIRLMAMCFAFYGLADAKASTVERKIKLITAIAVHAERIEKNIDFAISTRTNHSLTEAVGLYTTGVLFPEFERAEYWVKLGKKILRNEGLKQIYADGSYIQHSMNYHRLMLQDFLWVMRLAWLNDDSFREEIVSSVRKATEFLYQMQDENSARVPNYGANDGSLILPLNSCDYLDYRPVIQSCWYLLKGEKLHDNGPWDEDLLWLFGQEALKAPLEPLKCKSVAYGCGGYYTLRSEGSWAMMRCHSYKDRPGHADMLHLDLWWKGINVLRDCGSFMYTSDEPWQNYFGSTAAHNAVTIDGHDQMAKASRFMWFYWTKAKLIMHKSFVDDSVRIMQGEHYGYCRKDEQIIHRRSVLSLPDGCWLIVDDVIGTAEHRIRLYWQLCDCDYKLGDNQVLLQTDQGPVCLTVLDRDGDSKCRLLKGEESEPAGWESLYYGRREPSPVLICSQLAQRPTRFVTLVVLGDVQKDMFWSENGILSWTLCVRDHKYFVGLNSIGESQSNSFSFAQVGPKKIIFDK